MFKKSPKTANQTEDALFLVCREVKQDISEVVEFLKERLSNTSAFQHMPWYLVLGAKNAGTSQLIAKSELDFLETDRFVELTPEGMETKSGVNWWLSSNAVLIDVPGTYLEESANLTPERAAWFELLSQIRHYRVRRPLNGIILTMDVQSLQRNHFNWMRGRIEEVLHRLKQRLPLYLVITQMDQIQGFHEYYDDLGKTERDQFSGLTFSLNDKLKTSWAEVFSENFDKLISNLHQRMLWRVHQERESLKRNKILNFPQQLNSIKDNLKTLIHDLSSVKTHASLRGVYFTSCLKNESPAIDVITETFEKHFALAPVQNASTLPLRSERAFFIKTLFEQKIFPESCLANDVLRATASRQDNFLRWSTLGFAGIILLSITFTLSQHYKQQTLHLNMANAALSEYKLLSSTYNPVDPQLDKLLPALDALAIAQQNAASAQLPWLLRFQLHRQLPLAALTEQLYTNDLQLKLIPTVRAKIEAQLQNGNITEPAQLYGLLKVYLMLGDPLHADKHFLQNWFENWQNPLMRNQDFRKHLNLAINNRMPVLSQHTVLIQKIRSELNALPYDQISNAVFSNNLSQTPPLVINILNNNTGIFLLPSKNISGLYTAAQITQINSELNNALYTALNGNWILGSKTSENLSPATLKVLQNNLINQYVDNYVNAWQQFLSQIQIRKFTSLTQLEQALQILTKNHSPLEQILAVAQQNTQLNEQEVNNNTTILFSALSNKLNTNFNALNNIALQNIQASLQSLGTQIRGITYSQNSGAEALEIAQNMAKQKKQDIIHNLVLQASALPEPIKTWLISIANQSRDLILAKASQYTWQQWQLQVLPLCRASIENHYPVDKSADKEISLSDFGRFFENGGIFKQFFTIYLSPFVETSTAKWQWKNIDGGTFSQDNHRLSQFERANIIQELFFNSKNQLLVPFSLSLNKKNHYYIWPQDTQDISVILNNNKNDTINVHGNWSIFKLIDEGTLKPHADGKTYDLIFNKTTYTLNAMPLNPFVPGVINQFKCP